QGPGGVRPPEVPGPCPRREHGDGEAQAPHAQQCQQGGGSDRHMGERRPPPAHRLPAPPDGGVRRPRIRQAAARQRVIAGASLRYRLRPFHPHNVYDARLAAQSSTGSRKVTRVAVVYHFFAHYRQGVLRELLRDPDHFYVLVADKGDPTSTASEAIRPW